MINSIEARIDLGCVFKPINKDWSMCCVCGLMKRLTPQTLSRNEIYTLEWARKNRLDHLERDNDRLKVIERIFPFAYGTSTLDIGCGGGSLVNLLRNHGYDSFGLDDSENAINIARQGGGVFYCGTFGRMAAIERLYNVVTLNHVLEHLPEPQGLLEFIRGLLKKQGILYLTLPNGDYWDKQSLWRWQIEGNLLGVDHSYVYGVDSVKRLLARNGFRVIKVWTTTYSPIIQQGFVGYTYHRFIKRDFGNQIPAPKLLREVSDKATDNVILDTIMYPLNRFSERNCKGEELSVLCFVM